MKNLTQGQREKTCDEGRDWSYAPVNQGGPNIARKCQESGKDKIDFILEASGKEQPCQQFDLRFYPTSQ
jgi:hypothetical protein